MTAAIVPVKTLSEAKGRLATLLTEDERSRLALAMLEDVLRALDAVPAVSATSVVSPDAAVLDFARALGARPVPEPPLCRGVNQALDHAAATLDGATALLVLAADIPAADPDDIATLLEALPARGVAIAPTEDKGTGALALRPLGVIPFRYGRASSTLHKREAAARAIPARVLHLPSLSRDVDEPSDVAALLAAAPDTSAGRLLHSIAVADRLAATNP